jgi:hypothetical protein
MMGYWKNGMMGWRPSGRYTPAAESGREMLFYYSTIPLFQYSRLGTGNNGMRVNLGDRLLSTICTNYGI